MLYNPNMETSSAAAAAAHDPIAEMQKAVFEMKKMLAERNYPYPKCMHIRADYWDRLRADIDQKAAGWMVPDMQNPNQNQFGGLPIMVHHGKTTPLPYWFEWDNDLINAKVTGFKYVGGVFKQINNIKFANLTGT